MKYKLKLTNQILSLLTEFYRLHGALYSTLEYGEYKNDLLKIAKTRSAMAAVMLGAENEVDPKLFNSYKIIVPENAKKLVDSYIKVKSDLPELASLPYSPELLFDINKKVLGKNKATLKEILRLKTKVLPKIVFENNVYKKVNIIVRSDPKQINHDLKKLGDWLTENTRIINPIILAAITYFYIARIHPFLEGNGRTSKILAAILLQSHNLDKESVVIFEEYFLKNRVEYYDQLTKAIETGDITEWLEFFSNACLYGISESCRILHKLSGGSIDIINNRYLHLNDKQKLVVASLQGTPGSTGADIGRKLDFSRQYAHKIIQELIDLYIIEQHGSNRSSLYALKNGYSY